MTVLNSTRAREAQGDSRDSGDFIDFICSRAFVLLAAPNKLKRTLKRSVQFKKNPLNEWCAYSQLAQKS